jgi:hypothetical protein
MQSRALTATSRGRADTAFAEPVVPRHRWARRSVCRVRSPLQSGAPSRIDRGDLVADVDRCHSGTVVKVKTRPSDADVSKFLDSVPDERRRGEGHALRSLFERVTGEPAVMWGPSMVGFGSRPYTNTTGTNDWFVVGFSPRKNALTIYGIHDGYANSPDPLLEALGPSTTGKSCVYIKRLDRIDQRVLERMVRNAWESSSSPT